MKSEPEGKAGLKGIIMKKRLDELLKNAYGKYSDVQVSAIIIDKNGNKYEGVNVENAAFPSSICAERNAIFHAVSKGMKPGDLKEVHITSSLKNKNLYPCGACMQVIQEFMPVDGKLSMYHKDEMKTHSLKEISPFGVNPESFEWK